MEIDLEKLCYSNYMKVYSFVMTLSKNSHIAEEVTQKTFLKAISSMDKFKGESSEFTWLCSIARNLFIDETRTWQRSSNLLLIEYAEQNIEEALIEESSLASIHQALHMLEEPYKEVFHLRTFGELSYRKIASLFQKTESWARVTYHRARIKIQERIKENEV